MPLHAWQHGISNLFNFRSSSGCVMASDHGFIFPFPGEQWEGGSFPLLIVHYCVFFDVSA